MTRRTFFRSGVINVHNRAADDELVAALARIEKALANLPTAVTINNPATRPELTGAEASQYLEAYTRLRPEERLRGAATSVTFKFTARELKRALAILPGLQMVHPEWDLPALVTEAKQILSDAAEAGDE